MKSDLGQFLFDSMNFMNRSLAAGYSRSRDYRVDPQPDPMQVAQDIEAERKRRINNTARELLASRESVGELLNENHAAIVDAIIESMRPTGDPTAFRAEVARIALDAAELKHPVGSVTADDVARDDSDE